MPDRVVSLDRRIYLDLVRRALAEDIGSGDVTTRAVVPADQSAVGTFLVKQSCVIAGLDIVGAVLTEVDTSIDFAAAVHDGDRCAPGAVVGTARGPAAALLTAERTALNFLQRLSGIATTTRRFVDAAAPLAVLDTRKTTPTMRALEKYAVRCGGATSHRAGLFDAVLIKDNHIRIAGGLTEAVARARRGAPGLLIEVETQSLDEVDEAMAAGADVIMLDNLSNDVMAGAIARIGGRARVEISGGVTLDRLPSLARLGADWVSIGAITHSAAAVDISLDIACSTSSPTTSPTR